MRSVLFVALLAACGSFEDESIVLDLRVLAMQTNTLDELGGRTNHADMVLDLDLSEQPTFDDILAQLRATEVTALVSDPSQDRELAWTMTLCLPDNDGRCDRALPYVDIGASTIADPELSATAAYPRATIVPGDPLTGQTMVAMLLREIQDNPVTVLGGVDLVIEMAINGVDAPHATDVYATKKLRIAPRVPSTREVNTNPSFDALDQDTGDNINPGFPVRVGDPEFGRCHSDLRGEVFDVPRIKSGTITTLFPIENVATRETYVTPGLDGSALEITETISYQWLATNGHWSDDTTGGGHDVLGNQSLLGSDWRAPDVNRNTDVSLWMIQRDERYGVTWIESCVTVIP